ncbi:hypothetical protein [Sphingobium sp. WCS2017Hpa-17]|uniref:hypothetical protein n=1 Tax=Sphingobium sp. WCS2017Hpa-17 TaxID=3073638 RepID=UPI00288BA125|nr:hypothetical protein [Sphingobium sp. WCS2017Hpa-17]
MTTRRQLLAAAVAAPIVAVPASAAPMFSCHPVGPSSEWLAASEKMEIASAAYDTYFDTFFEPLWDAAREREMAADAELKRQIDAIPHYTTLRSYLSADDLPIHMTTESRADVRIALGFAEDILPEHDDFRECCRELVGAIGKRLEQEHAIKDAFPKAHMDIASHIPADIRAEEKRLETESYAAFRAVANFQAATPGDLIAKIEFLKSQDCEIDHDQMLADLRRVFGWASS